MTPERLDEILERFTQSRIAVTGDFFLDKYLQINPAIAEKSVETGKTAHQVAEIRRFPGAAGTVVNNLAALQCGELFAVGATGDDGEAFDLRAELNKRNCATEGLLRFENIMTPTYLKPIDQGNLDLSGEHERYDTKNRSAIDPSIGQAVIKQLDEVLPNVDAVIIADQVEEDDCGVITSSVRDELAKRALDYPDVIFWADSRTHIHDFRNVIIKANQFEAVQHENPVPGEEIEIERLKQVFPELKKKINAPICITRGEYGILVSEPEFTSVPGIKLDCPIDPTGAGDSVTAGMVLSLTSGASLAEAGLIGMLVASITVQQLATTGTATPEQVRKQLLLWREQNPEAVSLFG